MNRMVIAVAMVAGCLLYGVACAGEDSAKLSNLGKDRLALQGFDPVAYFESGKPSQGRAEFTAEHAGAIYRFATDAHRKAFVENPAKYAPAYGGWCATAMAEGKKVAIDPMNFKVSDGRLFVFYKSVFHDARKDWVKDESKLRERADAAWKGIVGQ